MKLKISTTNDAIKDSSGGASFLNTEGVFDVIINFASVTETKNGAVQLDLNIDYKGNSQVLYGPVIQNKDGNPNTIGMSLVNKLGVIAGLGDNEELDIEEETHAVGKDQEEKTFNVITNFSDMPIKIRVQREYSQYNGEVRRNLRIRNVFRADGASAAEIANGAEVGKQLALEIEKYSDGAAYVDGVTPEQAEAYEAALRNGGDKTTAPAGKVTAKRQGMFAKK